MPGIFNTNENETPVNEETREWLEGYFIWLINSFGKENIRNRKVLVPQPSDFPIHYNGQKESVFETLKIVATQMEIDPDAIDLHIYKEGEQAIDTGSIFGHRLFLLQVKDQKYSGGQYFGKQENGKYLIALEEKKLKDPIGIVATLAHELSHVKLLGEKRIEANNEYLTDLTTIIFGLGVFNANMSFKTVNNYEYHGWSKSGYLTQMQWGYALALFSHVREESNPLWVEFLSSNVKSDYKKSKSFIENHSDKIFVPFVKTTVQKPQSEVLNKILEARKNRDFQALVDIYKEQLNKNPNNRDTYNHIGYALLKQQKFNEAIDFFSKAIVLSPQWDFPYNNRGFCKLQIGDINGAFADINRACEMNPFNSFAWRNLGAYYLKVSEFEKALDNFEEAERIDDRTEMIYFYLGKAHEKLGNKEMAQEYFRKSEESNELVYVVVE